MGCGAASRRTSLIGTTYQRYKTTIMNKRLRNLSVLLVGCSVPVTITFIAIITTFPFLPVSAMQSAASMAKDNDRNQDGLIGRAEFQNHLRDTCFLSDFDKNGRISARELAQIASLSSKQGLLETFDADTDGIWICMSFNAHWHSILTLQISIRTVRWTITNSVALSTRGRRFSRIRTAYLCFRKTHVARNQTGAARRLADI